eukprot:CAMPEP_0196819906 /NCGR_PEP_ID=MMETSP1362-20130617/72826_1 /TAXON_ID=163516 /ORGANISM="Leptocylindrus danicus, Strain CCMP1856" /LENGTH=370 /DNA_ID=CAMNT_0042198567 /DNA_START=40 /DNA_END=1152 /DNA_ORIENTATION=+
MTMRNWQSYKEEGSTHYRNSNYHEALQCYNKALEFTSQLHDLDRQALLSNAVLCRLHLHDVSSDSEHLQKALIEARECIAVSRGSWAKAHYRLACVYVRMGRSNDACNSLQQALRIDSGYTQARALLVQELRRRDTSNSTSNARTSANDNNDNPNPYATTSQEEMPDGADEVSWKERLQYQIQTLRAQVEIHVQHMKMWYQAQNEMTKMGIQFLGMLVVLYILFGGRFGLLGGNGASRRREYRGNYGNDNAYSHYRYTDDHDQQSGYSSSSFAGRGRSRSYDDYSNDDYDYSRRRPSRSRSNSSFQLFDGSLFSMVVLMAFMYGANRFGINPFQALWALQVLTGQRARMGGFHMGGFGGGGYRRRGFRFR